VEKNLNTGNISIHQTHYIDDIVERFGVNFVSTLADINERLSQRDDPIDPPVQVPYKEAIRCIIYGTMVTRLTSTIH